MCAISSFGPFAISAAMSFEKELPNREKMHESRKLVRIVVFTSEEKMIADE